MSEVKVIEFLKKYRFIITVAVAGVLTIFALKSCDITDESSYWQGKYAGAKLELSRVAKEKDALIAAKAEEIAALDRRVQQLNNEIGSKTSAIVSAQGDLAKLQEAYKNLTDCPAKVENLTAQVRNLTESFSIQAGIIADKDKIIFALTEKYNAQVVITGAWEAKYMASESARLDSDKLIAALKSDLRKERLFGSVKTIGVMALAGIVTYNLLKK